MKNLLAILFLGCFTLISVSQGFASTVYRTGEDEKKSISESGLVTAEYFSWSAWEWTPEALEVLESYVPFIFRTKKSAEIDNLEVLVAIDEKGRIKSYKLLNAEEDKGLRERIGYALRQMPKAVALPGYNDYKPMEFKFIFNH